MKKNLALCLAAVMSIGAATTAFAGTDDAYFFGMSDALEEMEDVQYYMDDLNYYTKIYQDPTLSKYTNSRLNSSVLYVAGHGNRYSIDTGDDCGICIDGRTGFKDVSNNSFSRTEMAIMAACKTGGTESDYETSLSYKLKDNGANFVLAWTGSPNSPTLADYTKRFAYYVNRGYKYLDAAIKTKNYLINNIGIFDNSKVFDTILFGNVNDTLPEVSTRAAKQAAKAEENPVTTYIDNDLNQKVIDGNVTYNNGSSDFAAIEQYIIENVDADFELNDYSIKEFGEEENGVNLISFRLNVGGISSNYGFTVLCIDDEAKLITFTKNYNDVAVEDIKAMPAVMANMDDEAMKANAIKADGFDYDVDEQYIERYFDVNTGKVVNSVNTVYADENGSLFCTEHKI